MNDLTFLGITKSLWDIINGFANWFSAAGSFAAVVVALYIANRSTKPSAMVSVGHRILIEVGKSEPYPEYIVFRIVNTGDRPIRVIQIGWKVGLLRKRFAIQTYDQSQSSKLPISLTHGQEAFWYVPLSMKNETWLEHFARDMLGPHYRIALWTLRMQIFSSIGYVFKSRPEENLLNLLKEECIKIAKHKSKK